MGPLFPEKFLGGLRLLYPALLTTGGCKRLQWPRAHNYTLKEGFFAQCKISESFGYLVTFFYTGKRD